MSTNCAPRNSPLLYLGAGTPTAVSEVSCYSQQPPTARPGLGGPATRPRQRS